MQLEAYILEAHAEHPKVRTRDRAVRISLRPRPDETREGVYCACCLSETEALALAHDLLGAVRSVK